MEAAIVKLCKNPGNAEKPCTVLVMIGDKCLAAVNESTFEKGVYQALKEAQIKWVPGQSTGQLMFGWRKSVNLSFWKEENPLDYLK